MLDNLSLLDQLNAPVPSASLFRLILVATEDPETSCARPCSAESIICGMPKLHAFLSHLSVESRLADLLSERIIRDFIGLVKVFESSDRLSIPAGSKWLAEVTTGLADAQLHLVLCSREAVTRPWINFEAGAAHIRGITILPICHSGLLPAQLPVPLSENQGVVASDEEGLRCLYDAIARKLGSDTPAIDFKELAQKVSAFEREYHCEGSTETAPASLSAMAEIVEKPRALCVSSPQFLKFGFENQLENVINAFPASVKHQKALSSSDLREAMKADKFDIVHIAAYVCPRSGDLYFSDVDPRTGASLSDEHDVLDAESLARLFRFAKVKLAVVGSCDSMALAATLTTVCHVIAARDIVSSVMMASWVETFYKSLSSSSLLQALSDADDVSQAHMRFYGRQSAPSNVFFRPSSQEAAIA